MGRFIFAASLLVFAGCVAGENQPQSGELSSTQSALSGTHCSDGGFNVDDKMYYSCIPATVWNPSSMSNINSLWAGLGNGETPAKVMIRYEMLGKLYCNAGATCQHSAYVILVNGAPTGGNSVWKIYEVMPAQLATFHTTIRNLYDIREAGTSDAWDGATGNTNGGSPGPVRIGPHGFPLEAIQHAESLASTIRGNYNGAIDGITAQVVAGTGY